MKSLGKLKRGFVWFCIWSIGLGPMAGILPSAVQAGPGSAPIESVTYAGMKLAPGGSAEEVLEMDIGGAPGDTLNSIKLTITPVGSFAPADIGAITLKRVQISNLNVTTEATTSSLTSVNAGAYYTATLTPSTPPPLTDSMYMVYVTAASGATNSNSFKVSVENNSDVVLSFGPLGYKLTSASVQAVTIGNYPASISGTVTKPDGDDPGSDPDLVPSGFVVIMSASPEYEAFVPVDLSGNYTRSLEYGTYDVMYMGLKDFNSGAPASVTVNVGTPNANHPILLNPNQLKVQGIFSTSTEITNLDDIATVSSMQTGGFEGPPLEGNVVSSGGHVTGYSVTIPAPGDYIIMGTLNNGSYYKMIPDGYAGPPAPPTVTVADTNTLASPLQANGVVKLGGFDDGGGPGSGPTQSFAPKVSGTEQYYAPLNTQLTLVANDGQDFGATQGTGHVQLSSWGKEGPVVVDLAVGTWASTQITVNIPASADGLLAQSGSLEVYKDGEPFPMYGGNFVILKNNEGVFTGTVTKPTDDSPVANAEVEAESMDHSSHYNTQASSNGSFVIGPLSVGQKYKVIARPSHNNSEGFGQSAPREEVLATVGANVLSGGPMVLTNASITGSVFQGNGTTPVRDAWVMVHDDMWQNQAGSNTDDTGAFKIGGLSNGTYKIEVNLPPGIAFSAPANMQLTLATVDGQQRVTAATKSGETNILEPDGTIKIVLEQPQVIGKVVDPSGNGVSWTHIEVHKADWSFSTYTNTDNEGIFRIGGLTSGQTYAVEVHPSPNSTYSAPAPANITYSGTALMYSNPGDGVLITLANPQISGVVASPDGPDPGTDPDPVRWSGINIHNADWSVARWSGTNDMGQFSIGGLPNDNYTMEVNVPWERSDLIAPAPVAVTLAGGAVSSPTPGTPPRGADGTFTIMLTGADKFITGAVTAPDGTFGPADSNPDPVTDAEVHAWKNGANGWANTQTNGSGQFQLPVSEGDWNVMVNPKWEARDTAEWVYGGREQMVTVSSAPGNYPGGGLNFQVTPTNSTVTGQIYIGDSPSTLTPPMNSVWINLWSASQNFGTGTDIKQDGTFSFHVPAGTYEFGLYSKDYAIPSNLNTKITVAVGDNTIDGDSVQAGVQPIRIQPKNEFITGTVKDSAGNPLSGIEVFTFKVNGMGWANTTTDTNGVYTLSVSPGRWQVQPAQNPNSNYIYANRGDERDVAQGQTVPGVNFTMDLANCTISGKVVNSNHEVVSGIRDGYVWINKRNGGFGGGAQVQNGIFTIKAVAGEYDMGIGFPPGAPYTSEMTTVTLTSGQTLDAHIHVTQADATVTGNIKDGSSNNITGLWGGVDANDGQGGWQWAPINPSDGSYKLQLSSGKTWRLHVWVDPKSTAGDTKNYVYGGSDIVLNNLSAGPTTQNITLTEASSTINGTVTRPDGDDPGTDPDPVPYAWVYVNNHTNNSFGNFDTGAQTDNSGNYTIKVPDNATYNVGVGFSPDTTSLLLPDQQSATVGVGQTVTKNFAFTTAEGHINGQVTLSGSGVRAFVWAWSESGKNSHGETDASGNFNLSVSDNDTWHIGAVRETESGGNKVFYNSNEEIVSVGNDATVTQNIALNTQSQNLIKAVSETFDATQMKVLTLDDGTRVEIPAGALATSGNVTVTATPTAQSNQNGTSKPIGLAYDLAAFDANGALIEDFKSPVTITFAYTDQQVSDLGITEDALTVAYWDETTKMWKAVSSFNIDKTNNKITITTSHFSEWAPIGSGSAPTAQVSGNFANVTAGTTGTNFVVRVDNPASSSAVTSVRITRPGAGFSITAGSAAGWTPTVAGDNSYVDFAGSTIAQGAYADFTVTADVPASAVDVTNGLTWAVGADYGSGLTSLVATSGGTLNQNIRVLRVESVTITAPAGATDNTVTVGQNNVTVRVNVKNYGTNDTLSVTSALGSDIGGDNMGSAPAPQVIAGGANANFDFTASFDSTSGAHILTGDAAATGADAVENTANTGVGSNLDVRTVTAQSVPSLTIGDITSNKVKISKEAGATNTATVTIPVTNSGVAAASIGTAPEVKVRKASDNTDISSDFTIIRTDAVTTVAGSGGTANFTYTIEATTVTFEGAVKIDVSAAYNDANTGAAAAASPALANQGGDLAIDNTAPTFTSAIFNGNTNMLVTYDGDLNAIDYTKFTSAGFTASANGAVSTNTANITVGALANTGKTVSDMAIAAGAATDIAGNVSTQVLSDQAVADGQVPTISLATTADADGDGVIDRFTIVFSEIMDQSVTSTTGFALTGGFTTGGTGTWFNLNTFYLPVNEAGSANTAELPDVTYTDSLGDMKDNSPSHYQLGNVSAGALTETDGAGPAIISVIASDQNGGIDGIQAGDEVQIEFSESTNAPAINAGNINTVLALNNSHSWLDGGGAIGSAEWGVSNTQLIVTLSAGTLAPTVASEDTITASSAIKDALNNDAANAAFVITGDFDDHTVPTVTAVNTAHGNGSFKVDEVIDITVTYTETVNVDTGGGTPSIALNSGGSATYNSGTGTDTLTFRYTVGASQTSADLDYMATDSLALNGGTLKDASSAQNVATNTLPAVGTFGGSHAIVIDTAAPVVNAGTDKTDNSQVSQDATVTGATTYLWTKQSGSGTITFGTATAEDTTISADADDTYVIRLTATDAAGNSAFDEMTLVWDTAAPVVNAGTDKTDNAQVSQDATVTGATTYLWTKQSGSGTITFGTATAEDTTISADADDTYVIRLTATDAAGNSAFDEMTLNWDSSVPVILSAAFSPTSGIRKIGDTITMTITADAPGYTAGAITVNGVSVTGFADNGDNTYTVTHTVASGNTDIADDATIPVSVVLTDGAANSNVAYTTSPLAANSPSIDANVPVVSSGIDRAVYKGATVSQDGTVTGGATYSWEKAVGPGTVTFGSADQIDTTISADTPGSYILRLIATDAAGNMSFEDMIFTVHKNGDINNSGTIDNDDFTLLMFSWTTIANSMADLNSSGDVDNDDFTILMYWWAS
ncbi:TPA: hypothetical protein DHW59_00075 [candidate division CPR2 bacterium]|nr:hypothetical protein [candidate division CPR2 bacterium]